MPADKVSVYERERDKFDAQRKLRLCLVIRCLFMRRCYNLDLDPLITGEANMLTTGSDIGRLRRGPVENINP